jgi:FMN phosphatase YigB (HAD superfamily)
MKCLVLDAMGVIFQAADDVAELLVPFINELSPGIDEELVESAYLDASLGIISPRYFWSLFNISPEKEDDYLSRHSLIPGLKELLDIANKNDVPVWCLSNDVGQWSDKLRNNFQIEQLLAGAVVSGDVGVRKPDREIYEILIKRSGYKAEELLFVDDREKNIAAARDLGIETIMFHPEDGFEGIKFQISHRTL